MQTIGYGDLHIKLEKNLSESNTRYHDYSDKPYLDAFILCQSVWNQTNWTLSFIPYFKILFQHLSQGQIKEHHGVCQPQYMVFNTEPPDSYIRHASSPVYSVCCVCVFSVACDVYVCLSGVCACVIYVWYVRSMWHIVYMRVMRMWCVHVFY
jgi:hypothetical protein